VYSPARMKQISFLPAPLLVYGGTLVGKKRKGRRPLNDNSPIHVVLKSTKHILYANRRSIYAEIHE
jgi:hypothetical protein